MSTQRVTTDAEPVLSRACFGPTDFAAAISDAVTRSTGRGQHLHPARMQTGCDDSVYKGLSEPAGGMKDGVDQSLSNNTRLSLSIS